MKCVLYLLALFIAVEANWQLTFSDEFNTNGTVDTSKWTLGYPHTPTVINNELEYYTPDSFKLTGSTLRIVGRQRYYTTTAGKFNYSSGAMVSYHKFSQSYGYFEMRAKLPVGQGSWPAFWMMPENGGGPQEIDILETVNNPSTVYTTFHCNYSGGSVGGSKPGFANNVYHTYALQWIPGSLFWYVDGTVVFSVNSSCVPDAPSYLMLNLAIGGNWPGSPDSTTPWPLIYEIDYVRVYKYVASGGVAISGAVGAGLPYTARSFPQPAVKWGGIFMNAQSYAPGATVTITVKFTPVTAALDNANFQLRFSNDTADTFDSVWFTGGSAPVGTLTTVTKTWVIPSTYAAGYIRVGLGVWTSSWNNLYWQNCDGHIGVNRLVGGYY